ncbi:DUF3863 domain-containing protein [uncultured Mucilaginibacter sp.]|uniref:DUF3863 domain-containing protein n=1 Tax=uncultured Mucilaginibacter sp. TaxID=797541 RepID=UPI0025E0B59A|nr:DUF3863 domain-containing protein [uncultured Mucilaginibacter sp.]
MKSIYLLLSFVLSAAVTIAQPKPYSGVLNGNRFLTFNAIIRVNQIEATRTLNLGEDERSLHTPQRVIAFRKGVEDGFPGARITWALSWLALHDTTANYMAIKKLVTQYHKQYGDEITFIPGAYFSNAHNTRSQVNRDLHDGLAKVSAIVGNNYRPKCVVAGFLAAANQKYLAANENIHVCQGNIWSQYAIDNQDGEGSVVYPYYPSVDHFCKPAQSKADFIDCVNLDGWTMDFLAARREGYADGFNSRLGVGPIETLGKYGETTGIKEMIHATAAHFDEGFKLNKFGWVTVNWEVSLDIPVSGLTEWLHQIKQRWPQTQFITMGEFGLTWRKAYKTNNFNYQFIQRGSGIGGSDKPLEIKWLMNKSFRLALLRNWQTKSPWQVIDFTKYDGNIKEPDTLTRNWSILGAINQKQTRPQDKPVSLSKLSTTDIKLIHKYYPGLK